MSLLSLNTFSNKFIQNGPSHRKEKKKSQIRSFLHLRCLSMTLNSDVSPAKKTPDFINCAQIVPRYSLQSKSEISITSRYMSTD